MAQSKRELELELELERRKRGIQSPNAPINLAPQREAQVGSELLTGTVPVRFPGTTTDLARVAVPEPVEAGLITAGERSDLAASRATLGALDRPDLTLTAPLREQFPIATAVGDVAPGMAALFTGQTPTGAMAVGSGIGALTGDDPAIDAPAGAVGALAGNVAMRFAGKMISPFRSAAGRPDRAIKLAKRHKIPLRPGQRSGSKSFRKLEQTTQRTSLTTNELDDFDVMQEAAVNRAALRSIGRRGSKITDELIDSKRVELSDGFENLGKSIKQVEVDDAFLDQLIAIQSEAQSELTADSLELLNRNIDNLLDRLGNRPSGIFLMESATDLDRVATRLARRGDGAGDLLFDVKEAVDDLFEKNVRNLSTRSQNKLATLRREWRSLRYLRESNVVRGQTIHPERLRQAIKRKDPDGFRLGRKDGDPLYDIARLSEDIADIVPESGTPTGEALSIQNVAASPMRTIAPIAVEDPVIGRALANNLLNAARQKSLRALGARGGAGVGVQGREAFLGDQERQAIMDEQNRLLEEVISGFGR